MRAADRLRRMFPGGYGKDQKVRVLLAQAELEAWEEGHRAGKTDAEELELMRPARPNYREVADALTEAWQRCDKRGRGQPIPPYDLATNLWDAFHQNARVRSTCPGCQSEADHPLIYCPRAGVPEEYRIRPVLDPQTDSADEYERWLLDGIREVSDDERAPSPPREK